MKARIANCLPSNHPWKEQVLVFDSLPSTNTHAIALAKAGAPEGTVVIARHQTAGRGRMGRSFLSPLDSGLYMSLILRPHCPAQQLMHLTCAAAVAACDAIEALTGTRPGIKWINDLVLENRKLAGILTELGFTGDGLVSYAVVGMGINLHHTPGQLPPELESMVCSLQSATGQAPELPQLAGAMICSMEKMNQQLFSCRREIMERYKADCITLGREVKIISPQGTRQGKALDLDQDGALTVLLPDGSKENISSGEVSIRGLWDYV